MASSPMISKTASHARSISLPSIPHPITHQVNEHLCRLRSSQSASTSTSSVSQSLKGLKDLYDRVEELLLIPSNQQTLSQAHQSKWVNATLDKSLRLLDVCSNARDTLLQTQEHIQKIHSVLRRRCSAELTIGSEVVQYLNARKHVKKAIRNCLRDIKKADQYDETNALEGILSEVQATTADIFKSLLIHIAGPMQSKKSSWSLVNIFIHNSDNDEVTLTGEFEDLDAALSSLSCQKKKSGNSFMVDNFRSQIVKLEADIQVLDESLETLFRCLVKTRATILNILSS